MAHEDIKSVLLEERSFPPSDEFVAGARLRVVERLRERRLLGKFAPGELGAAAARSLTPGGRQRPARS